MMPVFTDALLGDTLHLSAEEFGAYCLLLFATWRNNGRALPEDDRKMARICRVTPRRWRDRLKPALRGFFNTSDGTWHQKRLEKEWQFCAENAAISRANGSKGGRPKILNLNGSRNLEGSVGITQKEPAQTQTQTQTDASASVEPARKPARREPINGKRTRIAADWWPDARDARYAEEQGHDAGWIEREAESFRDRCLRDEPAYADWHAAWRTWVRNAPKFAGYRGNGIGVEPTARPGTITHALSALLSRDDMERRER
jgi:uncharacterized protein YdaU (DUF1376 family)